MKKVVLILTLCFAFIAMMGLPICFAAANVGSNLSTTPVTPVQINPTVVITLNEAPTRLTATADGLSMGLIWTDNAADESGFTVERKSTGTSFTAIAKLGENSTSYKDSGLDVNTTYTYRVKVVTASGSSLYSNEASATTYLILADNSTLIQLPNNLPSLIKPKAPAKLRAELSGVEIDLFWLDQSNNEGGFRLERKTEGQEYAEYAILPADAATYTDINIALSENEKVYNYRVCAFNAAGTSLYSNEVSVTVPPSIITYSEDGSTEITVTYRIGQTSYTVNGQVYSMDVAPLIINDRTYLPIRYVAESLGSVINWDGSLQQVTVILNGTTVEMVINSNIAKVNGVNTPIADDPQVTPLLISDRVQVPVAFVAGSLGFDVAWDAALQEIILTYPKQ